MPLQPEQAAQSETPLLDSLLSLVGSLDFSYCATLTSSLLLSKRRFSLMCTPSSSSTLTVTCFLPPNASTTWLYSALPPPKSQSKTKTFSGGRGKDSRSR